MFGLIRLVAFYRVVGLCMFVSIESVLHVECCMCMIRFRSIVLIRMFCMYCCMILDSVDSMFQIVVYSVKITACMYSSVLSPMLPSCVNILHILGCMKNKPARYRKRGE